MIIAQDLDEAAAMTKTLESMPTVRSVMTPGKIIPEEQGAKLEVLKKIQQQLKGMKLNLDVSSSVDVDRARRTLRTLLDYSLQGRAAATKYSQGE
ncbi:MAG: hypothetical protein HC904_11135 [Blastochloris sp.]|nr:hypothetical protein [Blastochloris sp.]